MPFLCAWLVRLSENILKVVCFHMNMGKQTQAPGPWELPLSPSLWVPDSSHEGRHPTGFAELEPKAKRHK